MTGKSIVGCEYSAEGDRVFQTFDPVLNKFNETLFVEATQNELNSAVDLAEKTFQLLSTITIYKRADFLDEIATQIDNLGDKLLNCFVSESGLTHERAIVERKRTTTQLRSFANLVRENNWVDASIDLKDDDRIPPKPDLRKMLFGIGPVVVFGASNFPLAYSTAGGDTASAFAAGCPVIVKSHPLHAGTGEMVASAIVEAIRKTGMPKGMFSNLNAISFDIGKELVLHSKVKAVGFTGSIAGGRALFDLANGRTEPIPVFAEMGSVNPVIILPNALGENKEKWVDLYSDSISSGTGQFCTKPGLLFLIDSVETDAFIDDLTEKLLSRKASPMLHPSIYEKYKANKLKLHPIDEIQISEKKGVDSPNFAEQTIAKVSSKAFRENPILHEEIFGPFSLAIICSDLKDLENSVAELKGQLTGSLICSIEKFNSYNSLVDILRQRVGRLIFNGVPTGVEVCPSMHHGGPYPATTDSRFTAVGDDAIKRFARPIVFQNFPEDLLPETLVNENRTNCYRRIDGKLTKNSIVGKKI